MRRVLRALRLAEYGGDELAIGTLAACSLSLVLWLGFTPALAWLPFVPWAILPWFFRDPNRTVTAGDDLLISPADGVVKDIEVVDEPLFIQGKALRIGIFLSPLNVHVNRVPCAGTVALTHYRTGEFLPAYNPEAPTRNESVSLGLLADDGEKFLVKQITGVLARRIVCEAQQNERYAAGQRYGMIKFGSRTELYISIASDYVIKVGIGDKVIGGVSVLMQRKSAHESNRASANVAIETVSSITQ